jgi:hypothetical protein
LVLHPKFFKDFRNTIIPTRRKWKKPKLSKRQGRRNYNAGIY